MFEDLKKELVLIGLKKKIQKLPEGMMKEVLDYYYLLQRRFTSKDHSKSKACKSLRALKGTQRNV